MPPRKRDDPLARTRPAFHRARTLLTYTTDDGLHSEQILNTRDGSVPLVIALRGGQQAALTATEEVADDWTPPPGLRKIVNQTAAMARVRKQGVHAHLSWPGVAVIIDPEA